MSDWLKDIFEKDISYEEKVEEVKKHLKDDLKSANISFICFIMNMGCFGIYFIRLSPLSFLYAILSFLNLASSLVNGRRAKDFLIHVEKTSSIDLSSSNNNSIENNYNRSKRKQENLEKKEKDLDKKINQNTNSLILSLLLFCLSLLVHDFINISSFLFCVGAFGGVSAIIAISYFVKLFKLYKDYNKTRIDINKISFDNCFYENVIAKNKNKSKPSKISNDKNKSNPSKISRNNLSNQNVSQSNNTYVDAFLDSYIDSISRSGTNLEDEKPKTYSRK